MLYELHEWQEAVMRPMAAWSKATAGVLSDPAWPLAGAPMMHELAAGCALFERIGKRYDKPRFAIASTLFKGRETAIAERTVARKPFCSLRHFAKEGAGAEAAGPQHPTVLLVAPLSGHYATLLRDTVKGLLHDHDVYITDWHDARQVPLDDGAFGLDDYVAYVREFIGLLGPDCHVVAICQPTVPVLAAVALRAGAGEAGPRSMTLMGGPIDCRISPTRVNALAAEHPYAWFRDNLIHTVPYGYPGAGRKVYPGFLQYAGFVAMHPDKHMRSYLDYYQQRVAGRSGAVHEAFYDEYNAVLDMTAEFYLDTIKVVFQEFELPRGAWQCGGQPVQPAAIRDTALLTVEGGQDDICGAGQTEAAHALCSAIPAARKRHLTVAQSGHFGIFSGQRWQQQVCPAITDFIRAHQH
jgi:poly(3-hydroxybutyrate) depolymerase